MEMKYPVPVIMDIDLSGDCTNLGALHVLNTLADEGEAQILSVTVGLETPFVAGCVHSVCLYHGRTVPIGTLHGKKPPEICSLADVMCRRVNSRYPENAPTEDAVRVIRRAIADEEDGSVVFIITGHLSTAVALMDSVPDDLSPLTGMELIRKKIRRTVVMAGRFPETFGDTQQMEWNISLDVPAARRFCAEWEGEVVFTGWELGVRVLSCEGFVGRGDKASPVRLAYERQNIYFKLDPQQAYPSWDATAVLEALHPGKYFDYHPFGRITVDGDGCTWWNEEAGGKQTYLLPKTPLDEVGALITELMERLPPHRDDTIMKEE